MGYSENQLYAGIPEALEALATANVPMGLCTSKRADFAENILKMFSLRQHFQFLSGGDIGVLKRQQLATLLEAQRISASSVMVGDRAVDVESAKANGLRSVGVLWGHGSEGEVTRAGPERLLSTPLQLVELASFL